MCRRFNKGPIIVLTVNFHQGGTERTQHLHANRLVVDEGAGATVGKLNTADNQLVFGGRIGDQIVVGQEPPRRMFLGEVESGNDLALFGALAHQSRFAARAKRQRERI